MEGLTVKNNTVEFGNSFGEYRIISFNPSLLFSNDTLFEPKVDEYHLISIDSSIFEDNTVNYGSTLLKVTEGSLVIKNSTFSNNKALFGTDVIQMDHNHELVEKGGDTNTVKAHPQELTISSSSF